MRIFANPGASRVVTEHRKIAIFKAKQSTMTKMESKQDVPDPGRDPIKTMESEAHGQSGTGSGCHSPYSW
jgi:hypothetical protein